MNKKSPSKKNAFFVTSSTRPLQQNLASDHSKGSNSDNVSSITHQFARKPDEWAEVMHRVAQSRDRAAFAQIFKHFAPKVKSYALMMRNVFTSPEMADELVQEVMLKVWRKAESFNPEKASVNTWLFTIARNARTDIIRKINRGDIILDNDVMWELEDDVEPVSSLELLRTQKNIVALLQALPYEQSSVVRQIYLEGKSQAEIANESGIPLGTIKSRVRLALAKMRVAMPDNIEGEL